MGCLLSMEMGQRTYVHTEPIVLLLVDMVTKVLHVLHTAPNVMLNCPNFLQPKVGTYVRTCTHTCTCVWNEPTDQEMYYVLWPILTYVHVYRKSFIRVSFLYYVVDDQVAEVYKDFEVAAQIDPERMKRRSQTSSETSSIASRELKHY